MMTRIAALFAALALVGASGSASAQSAAGTQYGTPAEYAWLRGRLRDPGYLAQTIAKCRTYMASAPHMDILVRRTGIAEAVLRETFCERYYGGLATGRISLNEYLHQDRPTRNYIRVLQGR